MPQHELQSQLCIGSAVIELPIYVQYKYHEGAVALTEPGGVPVVPEERPWIEVTGIKVLRDRKVWGQFPEFIDTSALLGAISSEQMQEIADEILESYDE